MNTFDPDADGEADDNTETNINTNMTNSNSNSNSTTHEESSLLLSYCILWSPLHPITAFLPFIGHMGISDSQGRAHDFQGPFHVGTDQSYPVPKMAFGYPTRFFLLKLSDIQNSAHYDAAIQEADRVYAKRMHNICCDNSHSHVARALNIMNYQGRHSWNMIQLCFLVFFQGSFVGSGEGRGSGGGLFHNQSTSSTRTIASSLFCQFGPFLILLFIILVSTGVVF